LAALLSLRRKSKKTVELSKENAALRIADFYQRCRPRYQDAEALVEAKGMEAEMTAAEMRRMAEAAAAALEAVAAADTTRLEEMAVAAAEVKRLEAEVDVAAEVRRFEAAEVTAAEVQRLHEMEAVAEAKAAAAAARESSSFASSTAAGLEPALVMLTGSDVALQCVAIKSAAVSACSLVPCQSPTDHDVDLALRVIAGVEQPTPPQHQLLLLLSQAEAASNSVLQKSPPALVRRLSAQCLGLSDMALSGSLSSASGVIAATTISSSLASLADPPWYSEAEDDARLRSYYDTSGVWAQIVDDGVFVQTLAPMAESPFQRSRQNSTPGTPCEIFCCGSLFIEEIDSAIAEITLQVTSVQETPPGSAVGPLNGQFGFERAVNETQARLDDGCNDGEMGAAPLAVSNSALQLAVSMVASPTSATPRKSPRYVQRRQKSNVRQKSLISLTSQSSSQNSRSFLLSPCENDNKQKRMRAALARRFPSRSEEMINWATRNFQVGGYAARWLQQRCEASVQTSATRPGPALKLTAKVRRNTCAELGCCAALQDAALQCGMLCCVAASSR
jgi:hypothetical protein